MFRVKRCYSCEWPCVGCLVEDQRHWKPIWFHEPNDEGNERSQGKHRRLVKPGESDGQRTRRREEREIVREPEEHMPGLSLSN